MAAERGKGRGKRRGLIRTEFITYEQAEINLEPRQPGY